MCFIASKQYLKQLFYEIQLRSIVDEIARTKKSFKAHLDWVGEREGDSERKSFWNRDDENCDTDDDELHVVTEVVCLPVVTLVVELRDAEPGAQDGHRQQGDCHALKIQNCRGHGYTELGAYNKIILERPTIREKKCRFILICTNNNLSSLIL